MKLKLFCGVIFLLLIGIISYIVYLIRPHRNGDIHLDYGFGSARVYYEDNGVPHIYADNKKIAAFTLGYLHGADRLWQYEYLRRLSQGRLSEVFGDATLKLDEAMRHLGLKQSCNLTKEYFTSSEIFDYYDYYSKGMNKFAEVNPLSFYFYAFFLKFENWTPTDTCTCVKFFHFALGHNWGFEISRDYIEAVTKDEHLINMLFPFHTETFDELTTHVITEHELQMQDSFVDNINEIFANSSRAAKLSTYLTEQVKIIDEELKDGIKIDGSNSWAISEKHTKSGKPIFCSDPHLSNSVPSIWYLSHIEFPDGSYIFGANFPGCPIPAIGSTDKIAYGITNIYADNSDIYEEIIVDDKYLYNNNYYPLEIRKEIIKVKGKEDQILEIKLTRNGPLLQNYTHVFNIITVNTLPIKIQSGYFSLKWTGFEDVAKSIHYRDKQSEEINSGYSTFETVYKSVYSKSVYEFIEINRQATGVHLAVGVADVHGNIGFVTSGSYAKRKHKKFGNRISIGWTDENDWIGFVQPNEKPFVINPEKGFIVHANGPITTNNVEAPVAVFVPGTSRAMRITILLQILISKKSGMIEYSDMIDILNDTKDIYVEKKKDYLIKILRKHFVKEQHYSTLEVNQIMNWLHFWDSNFDKNLEEPTYYTLWEYFIIKNMLTTQLQDIELKLKIFSAPQSQTFMLKFFENIEKNLTYKSEYCVQYNGLKINSCPELIARAFLNTIEYLRPFKNKNETSWGSFHPAIYPNIPFSRTRLKSYFEGNVPASGSDNTIYACQFRQWDFLNTKFACKVSANTKMITEFGVEVSSPISSNKIIANEVHYSIDSGQSENPFSGLYFNINERHLNNDLYSLLDYKLKNLNATHDYSLSIVGKYDAKDHVETEDL